MESWERVGGWERCKRIRQGSVFLYAFLDAEGDPIGSTVIPVREAIEAPVWEPPEELTPAIEVVIGAIVSWLQGQHPGLAAKLPPMDQGPTDGAQP